VIFRQGEANAESKLITRSEPLNFATPTNAEGKASDATNKIKGRFDLAAVFITVFFFFQWLPYILISRLTFIYHYYLDVPFLCLASGYVISKVWPKKWGKVFTLAYFASAVILFALFYPIISGDPTSFSWINHLKLIKGWLLP
jgi:dolichyl-phosphate-mannose--protein O-mannosyl transferase